ncbi:ABC transporter substrate-binding protein [Catenulispora subtropica]|uniref:ABC transporter substrate-binding protein n=1 Tax=Catenulispora subtropica TaxID=450798 RepID=A0ABN2T1C7_9ACTN
MRSRFTVRAPRTPRASLRTFAAAAGVAALTLTAACSGSDGSDGNVASNAPALSSSPLDPNTKVTLTMWSGQTADAEKSLENLAADYHKAHPNVTIDVTPGAPTTDELLQKISAGFVGNTFPDISYAFGSWASQLGHSGHTLDLTSSVAVPGVDWGEFPGAARQTATVDGKVIGVPAVVDNLGLVYNKKIFDDAHVPYPTDDWSWDDFRAAAKKLTDSGKGIFGTAYPVDGSEDTTWRLWPLLWQKGGDVLSPDGKKATFNSDAGVQALEFLRKMAVDDKSMYLDQTDQKFPQLFLDGKIAMQITGPWTLQDMKTAGTDYGVTRLPGFGNNHETVSGPDIWVALDHHDVARATATRDFLLYLTSKDGDVKWSLANGNLPLRASEQKTPEYEQFAKDFAPGAQKFVDNLNNATKSRPTVPGYVEMSKHVGDAIAKVLQGDGSAKSALDQAARESEDALNQ